jgi:hypothetical protein
MATSTFVIREGLPIDWGPHEKDWGADLTPCESSYNAPIPFQALKRHFWYALPAPRAQDSRFYRPSSLMVTNWLKFD